MDDPGYVSDYIPFNTDEYVSEAKATSEVDADSVSTSTPLWAGQLKAHVSLIARVVGESRIKNVVF